MNSVRRSARRRPDPGRPTILVVAMGNSVHTARWLNMVRGMDARLVLVPVDLSDLCPELCEHRMLTDAADLAALPAGVVGVFDLGSVDRERAWAADAEHGYRRVTPLHMTLNRSLSTPYDVQRAIEIFAPNLIHSMEVQSAGYLTLEARRRVGPTAPPWLLSNWGSDIYLYRRLADHRPLILEALATAAGYLAECRRDVAIARELGFRGRIFDVLPASGGADFSKLPKLEDLSPPSARRSILVKGYHGWAGRGLHILSALHLAAPALKGFTLRTILAPAAAVGMAAALRAQDGLDVELSGYAPTHAEAIGRLSSARMVVSSGISDGISTTLLEAMSVGTFPIQADTSCACEWVQDGRDAKIVSPHDVRALADAIATAANDNALVDAAAHRNRATVETRWDADKNAAAARSVYQSMLDGAGQPAKARSR